MLIMLEHKLEGVVDRCPNKQSTGVGPRIYVCLGQHIHIKFYQV